MRIGLGFLIAVFAFIGSARAAPLSREALTGAKRVAIYFGTFDPFTKGHRAVIEAALKNGVDRVILCPLVDGGAKAPTYYGVRIRLIDHELHGNPSVLYPSEGELRALYEFGSPNDWPLVVRTLIGDAKLDVVMGEDAAAILVNQAKIRALYAPDEYLIFRRNRSPEPRLSFIPAAKTKTLPTVGEGSSGEIRKWFANHPEVYFDPGAKLPDELASMLTAEMFEEIRREGVYLGYPSSNHISRSERLKNFIAEKILAPLGILNPMEDARRSRLAKADLKEFVVNGERLEIERFLGNGFNGNAYVVSWRGRKAVLKIPLDGPEFRDDLIRAALVNRWLRENTEIKTADLLAVATDGSFMITAFEDAPTGERYLREFGVTPELAEKGEAIFRASRALYERNGMIIDLNSGNFVVEAGGAVLIDPGLQHRGRGFFSNFTEILKTWAPDSWRIRCRRLFGFAK